MVSLTESNDCGGGCGAIDGRLRFAAAAIAGASILPAERSRQAGKNSAQLRILPAKPYLMSHISEKRPHACYEGLMQ